MEPPENIKTTEQERCADPRDQRGRDKELCGAWDSSEAFVLERAQARGDVEDPDAGDGSVLEQLELERHFGHGNALNQTHPVRQREDPRRRSSVHFHCNMIRQQMRHVQDGDECVSAGPVKETGDSSWQNVIVALDVDRAHQERD